MLLGIISPAGSGSSALSQWQNAARSAIEISYLAYRDDSAFFGWSSAQVCRKDPLLRSPNTECRKTATYPVDGICYHSLDLHLNHPMPPKDLLKATGEAGAQSEPTRSTAAIAPPTYAWRKTRARAAHCAAPTAWPKYATERSTERTLRSVVTVATTMVPLSRRRR